jgi:hypothetical protein
VEQEGKNEKQLVGVEYGVLHLLSLGSESTDRHFRNNIRRQVLSMVSSKNFPAQNQFSDTSESLTSITYLVHHSRSWFILDRAAGPGGSSKKSTILFQKI